MGPVALQQMRQQALALLPASEGKVLNVCLLAMMGGAILSILKAGAGAAYSWLLLFAAVILVLAVLDLRKALAVYLAFCAMEGMFKYATDFSQLAYIVKPALICVLLASTWRSCPAWSAPCQGLVSIFLVLAAFATLNPLGAGLVQGSIVMLVWYATPMAMYFVGHRAFRTTWELRPVVVVLLGAATVVSLFAIFQFQMGEAWCLAAIPGYANIGNFAWMAFDQTGDLVASAFRPASTTSFGGAASGWAQLGAVIATTLLFWRRGSWTRCVWPAAALVVNLAALIVCGVRSVAFIGICQVAATLWINARSGGARFGNLALLVGLSILILTAVQRCTHTEFDRRYADTLAAPLKNYQQSRGEQYQNLADFLRVFPLGIGYQRGATGGVSGDYTGKIATSRETQMNALAADMGLPGLLLALALIVALFHKAWQTLQRTLPTSGRPVAMLLALIFLGVLAGSLVGPAIQGNDFFWFALGTLFALPRMVRTDVAVSQVLAAPMPAPDEPGPAPVPA